MHDIKKIAKISLYLLEEIKKDEYFNIYNNVYWFLFYCFLLSAIMRLYKGILTLLVCRPTATNIYFKWSHKRKEEDGPQTLVKNRLIPCQFILFIIIQA